MVQPRTGLIMRRGGPPAGSQSYETTKAALRRLRDVDEFEVASGTAGWTRTTDLRSHNRQIHVSANFAGVQRISITYAKSIDWSTAVVGRLRLISLSPGDLLVTRNFPGRQGKIFLE